MKIAFDIDNVLYPFVEALRGEVWRYGIPTDDPVVMLDAIRQRGRLFERNLCALPILYDKFAPDHGAVEHLKRLHKAGHEIYYITLRPSHVQELTRRWLERYGFPCYENLIFTDRKSRIIRELTIPVLLDDRPEIAEEVKQNAGNCLVFLLNCPWNLGYPHPSYLRVSSVKEFCTKILEMEETI